MHKNNAVSPRSRWSYLDAAGRWIGLAGLGLSATSTMAAETRSYVLSWIVPAMYSQDGDCRAIEPIADPGRTPVDSMFRKILLRLGKSPAEIDKLIEDAGN